MNYGAEPADQVVRYSLEGMEYSLKITGNVAKHVAIFIAAALKDQKKTRGKTRLTRMLKEQRPMKFFTVPGDRLKEFAKESDYIKIASAYDIPAKRVFTREELADAIDEMIATDGPFLLEACVIEEGNVLPMTPPGGSVNQMLLEC